MDANWLFNKMKVVRCQFCHRFLTSTSSVLLCKIMLRIKNVINSAYSAGKVKTTTDAVWLKG